MTIPGLMQTTPLNIIDLLRHAAVAHPAREIISKQIDAPLWRSDYAGTFKRTAQAAHLLGALGVKPGDRVTSLAWNTHRHFELFYAVPGIGAVLHTANPRLPDAHLIYTIVHAESRVLLYDTNMAAIVERLRPRLPHIDTYIELSAADYDARIAPLPDTYDWPVLDENTGSFLCYTSGTTGDPKGVLYSHRSVVLHAFASALPDAFGLSSFDVIMPCSSLYHATAWGLPFGGTLVGAKFVLPSDQFDGASLSALIQAEGVTFSGGVPTIWTLYLEHLARTGESAGSLERLVIGGSAVPRAMAETFHKQYGVKVRQLWGMTETSPIGVSSSPSPAVAVLGEEAMNDILWTRQGRMIFGVEIKIVDEDGADLPHDGVAAGALLVRGPWVVERYYKSAVSALDADGWFDTGDISTIDANGFMRITDRKKDVIKSGGEWISSIDIENAAVGCPGVKIAAVVGVFHPKWEERPILLIEPHDGAAVTAETVRAFLVPQIAKWWLPDAIIVTPVPLTATGKIDKKTIRATHADVLRG
jgi:fatty-acyl-CoA synthase